MIINTGNTQQEAMSVHYIVRVRQQLPVILFVKAKMNLCRETRQHPDLFSGEGLIHCE